MRYTHVWLSCKSERYGVEVSGLLVIEFEDSAKARVAMERVLKAIGDALASKCSMEKVSMG